ncbi:hypothetical protein Bbelb_221520 [Branchiostoma belcheri]|nr:hypothetical protein Bbelb_221520 [Branchiostoma belcheri]
MKLDISFRIARGTSPTADRIARRPEGDPIRGRAGTEGDAEYTVLHADHNDITNISAYSIDAFEHLSWRIHRDKEKLFSPFATMRAIKRRLVTQDRKDALGLCMGLTDLSAVYRAETVDEKVETFNNIVHTMMDTCVPLKTSRIRSDDKPWMNNTIKAAIRERQTAFLKYGKTDRWKKLRNHIKRLIRKQRKKHYDRCIATLKKTNPRDWWRFVNNQLGRTQKSNRKTTWTGVSDNQVADVLNDHFAEAWSDSSTYNLFPLLVGADELCSIGQVKQVLKHQQHGKACGPDNIPNWVLSLYCEDLAPVISHMKNFSYNTGTMPSCWKVANICPIPKTSVPTSKKDWRPISLISSLGKVQERLVLNKFLPFMSPWIKDQYAYMPKCSTTLALVKAYQTWLSNLENRDTSMVRVLLADMSKAFDRVDHGILLQLLAVRDTPPKMLGWIHSYLTGRKQRVVANNQQSNWNVVTSGVPQGGVLSPYLFLVYMSSRETVHQTTSNIGYADDIGLSRTFTCDTVESDTTMQEEATQLDTWANKNNMIMNGDKSYELRLCFSKNPPVPPPLTLGGKEVPVVECATYLGFKLHRSLGWDSQILHMAKKGSTRLHFLRMLKKGGMPPEDVETVYTTLIRPVLEYANVVTDGKLQQKLCSSKCGMSTTLRQTPEHTAVPEKWKPLLHTEDQN